MKGFFKEGVSNTAKVYLRLASPLPDSLPPWERKQIARERPRGKLKA